MTPAWTWLHQRPSEDAAPAKRRLNDLARKPDPNSSASLGQELASSCLAQRTQLVHDGHQLLDGSDDSPAHNRYSVLPCCSPSIPGRAARADPAVMLRALHRIPEMTAPSKSCASVSVSTLYSSWNPASATLRCLCNPAFFWPTCRVDPVLSMSRRESNAASALQWGALVYAQPRFANGWSSSSSLSSSWERASATGWAFVGSLSDAALMACAAPQKIFHRRTPPWVIPG